ncbi:MAG: hypothetical protein IJ568_07315 [Bacilli bacterium]|nr:hypothetical protein [Bacilli bacterium]
MSKKKKVEKIKSYSSDSDEMMRMLKVLGGVVLTLVIFYLVFAIAKGEISFGKKEDKTTVEIQNIEIIAGNSFSRSEEEYYVMMYNFDNSNSIKYANLYELYSQYSNGTKLYLVDLSKKFNDKYITENESEVNIENISSLKVVDGTLIKVSNKTGVSSFIGYENIKKELLGE